MKARTKQRSARGGEGSGRLGGFALGVVCTVAVGGAWMYQRYGHRPEASARTGAVTAPAPRREPAREPPRQPLRARMGREVEKPPFGTSEDGFEAGARLYVASCANCHGRPGQDAAQGLRMLPSALQLWKRRGPDRAVGISDKEAGEVYRVVKNGMPGTGMPAYQHLYTETQMWQVALLLKNADGALPEPVSRLLAGGATGRGQVAR